MKSLMDFRRIAWVLALAGTLSMIAGCDFFKTGKTRWLSPEKAVKAPKDASPVRAIRRTIGPADQASEIVPGAEFPKPSDREFSDEDYVLGPGDILDISVLDLFSEGLETVLRRQVTESGYIDLPLLPMRILAKGLTKEGLKDAIISAYSPDILRDPTVSVTIVTQKQNTFSVIGAVTQTGQYNIVRPDMRLLEALALAGGVTQSNIRYVYVIRQTPPQRVETDSEEQPTERKSPEKEPLPELPEPFEDGAEQTQPAETQPGDSESTQPTQTKPSPELDALKELGEMLEQEDDEELPAPSELPSYVETSTAAQQGEQDMSTVDTSYKWVWTNGRWVRVAQDAPAATEPSGDGAERVAPSQADAPDDPTTVPEEMQRGWEDDRDLTGTPNDPFGWKEAGKSGMARVIAVDLEKLRNGNPRMNVVVRDQDVINVPDLKVGEFYVMGEVARPGVYSLTGRRVTVKMAIAAAGNLGPLAWPENSVLIRRVGNAEEQMIPLDIEAIVRGEQEDIFLKPDDVIAVGTDVRSSFYAVLRNAFRMTYGFGFIYDRNFAEPLDPMPLDAKRFTRW